MKNILSHSFSSMEQLKLQIIHTPICTSNFRTRWKPKRRIRISNATDIFCKRHINSRWARYFLLFPYFTFSLGEWENKMLFSNKYQDPNCIHCSAWSRNLYIFFLFSNVASFRCASGVWCLVCGFVDYWFRVCFLFRLKSSIRFWAWKISPVACFVFKRATLSTNQIRDTHTHVTHPKEIECLRTNIWAKCYNNIVLITQRINYLHPIYEKKKKSR